MKNKIIRWLTLADTPVVRTETVTEENGGYYAFATLPNGGLSLTVTGAPGDVLAMLKYVVEQMEASATRPVIDEDGERQGCGASVLTHRWEHSCPDDYADRYRAMEIQGGDH